jgi:transcription elongation factor Elf1
MKLRDGNIIVCECGAELNPEITTPQDFITYANGVATCSNCGASAEIAVPTPSVCPTCGRLE